MAVTIKRITHTAIPTWEVSRMCLSWAEAASAAEKLDAVQSGAFMPNQPAAAIPVMPDVLAADADDDMGLTAGKAHPVAQDTGD